MDEYFRAGSLAGSPGPLSETAIVKRLGASLSGIVGIFRRDGGEVEPGLIRSMTRFLGYRGPDGEQIWVERPVAFGHALLHTACSSVDPGLQIAHLDNLAIAGDVRLDSTADLITELQSADRRPGERPSDHMLILEAYTAWGPGCVERLRGDFAFGIWDSSANTLFCARDHFGIKPFYYSLLGEKFVFSNTLNCLRQHPELTSELNEQAIGDFLLFGLNYNQGTTAFRDIQRLPPAHALLVSRSGLQTRCYWQPPTDERIRYSRDQEYVEHFNEILRVAVADRMGLTSGASRPVGILLSGGLDSGAVAVAAKDVSDAGGKIPEVRTYTVGYDRLFESDEGPQAQVLAEHLGLPNLYRSLDQIELFEKWDSPDHRFPEPTDNPLSAGLFEQFGTIALECRVALSGEGSDNLMFFQMWPYLEELWRTKSWGRLTAETASFLWIRPVPWRGIASRVRAFVAPSTGALSFPQWISPAFAKKAHLLERWRECSNLTFPEKRHQARPKAHASMLLPQWTNMFELVDPGITRASVEVRFPFLDLRMVNFLLAIPTFPWAYKKRIVRDALEGKLPDAIRLRRKTPLSADPVAVKLRIEQRKGSAGKTQRHLTGQILDFVNPSMIGTIRGTMTPEQLRPLYLDSWLQGIR